TAFAHLPGTKDNLLPRPRMIKKTLSRYFRRFALLSWSGRIALLVVQAVIAYLVAQYLMIDPMAWVSGLGLSTGIILLLGLVDGYLAQTTQRDIQKKLDEDVGSELVRLQKAKKRAESLQNM